MAARRVVTPLVGKLRDLFLQRPFNTSQRFEKFNYNKKDHPLPNIPEGPSHELSANDYCLRDGRRMSMAAKSVYEAGQVRLGSGQQGASSSSVPRPGFGYSLHDGKGL